MISVTVEADSAIEGLNRFIKNLQEMAEKELQDMAEETKQVMSVEGEEITYPVKWDSDIQKRAFFATNGFGKGIPTKRTGSYINGWQVEKIDGGALLINATKQAVPVGGSPIDNWQSNIHRGRWNYLPAVLQEIIWQHFMR